MRNYYLILILLCFVSCKRDVIETKLSACFNYSPDTLLISGDTITFSNCSENANSYLWDFGDGSTSTEKAPKHSFKNIGKHKVLLKSFNNNSIDTLSKIITIVKISACFNYSPDKHLLTGDIIAFSNCSENANSYLWDFGDGSTSTEKAPKHSFKNIGKHKVLLKSFNNNSIDTLSKIITIVKIISACFNYSPDTLLLTGDTIAFSNCSGNANSYLWDFGDGFTSVDEFPKHSYKNSGNYEVLLTATKGNLVDVISQSIKIQDQIFVDLHDIGVAPSYEGFDLDLNKDNIADIYFGGSSGSGSWKGSYSKMYIVLKNGYEIFISEGIESTRKWNGKDSIYESKSITIPKLFELNDTVKIQDDCTNNPIDLVSYQRERISSSGDVVESKDWINPEYNYMAFRKKTNNGTDLVWLKVKVPGYSVINLSSYKYFKNKDKIVIEAN